YNVLVGITVALGSLTYGFGFASFATSIGQPGFYEYFNLSLTGPDAAFTNNILGAINALFFFGAVVGALAVGPIADKIGRRLSIMASCVLALIGGALATGSVHIAMLIVVRVLQGIGLGALATLTPIYLSEASTPSKRGLLTGMHGFFLVCGYMLSGWVALGCSYSTNLTFGWRAPLAFTCLPPLLLLIGAIWIPESPRWLFNQGRTEEAWQGLRRLHSGGDDDQDEMATHEEFFQIKKQLELERDMPSGYWAIFTTPSYRKRAALACFLLFASNSTGALVITNYSVIIYTNLGLTGHMPLLLYAIYTLVAATGNLGSLLTLDWTGRRFALITGFTGCLLALILETVMIAEFVVSDHPSAAGQKVATFAIFFFVFFYGFFVDAASFVYSSEIFPTNIRSRGVALASATYFIACITYVTPGATAIANISWRYYVVFACFTTVSIFVVYFFFPETKGRSLEELAELFGDPIAFRLTNATE
ncbi:general substrate transporter, partial [Xylariales sp. PMI_506]